jgi:tetratricopeptide (TPR) repeat protein
MKPANGAKPDPISPQGPSSEKKLIRQPAFMVAALLVFATLLFAYKDHFNNPFHFDDAHTIVNNASIRSLGNIPSFFTDAKTFSSLPANQIYRPGVTTLNAIDYWIGGKEMPVPLYYHISIFISYVLLGLLLFLFFFKMFEQVKSSRWNKYIALFGAGLYCLHAANAETINYIIARSDSFSTLMVVLAFVIYQYKPNWRKKYIYIIPVIIGFFVKEPTIMFAPLLLVYILFFEKKLSLADCFTRKGFSTAFQTFFWLLPLFIVAIILYMISRAMASTTFTPGGTSAWHYILTQPYVIIHYVNNFILPVNLSADTDWTPVTHIFDERVLTGSLFLLGMIIFAIYSSGKGMLRPIAFGLFWFLLALLPTSIVPLAEVLNDHRTFFPYIGLAISAAWCFGLLLNKYEAQLKQKLIPRALFIAVPALILIGHAYGTMQRTEVWSSGEKLWYDVTIKSPNNGRGLMNYGNSQMEKGNYAVALDYFNRAQEKNPGYSYIFINKGVLKAQLNQPAEAEADYKTALSLDAFNPEAYYFYGKFLIANARYNEANEKVTQGLRVSPGHAGLNELKVQLDKIIANEGNALNAAIQTAKENPTPENYLGLSIAYYQNKKYDDCIVASQEALKLKPDFAEAYNNICSANNNLGNFDAAVLAGQKAVLLAPGLALAKNNLGIALYRKTQTDSLINIAKTHPNAANYIQLSLVYYNFGCYQKCVDAATEALKYDANSSIAYNNICSGYNMLAMWDKAIEAGEKGLKISPDDNLLKNNLQAARLGKAAEK